MFDVKGKGKVLSTKQLKDEKVRLRELACRTLEAYRNLNTVAAEASLLGSDKPNGEGLTRAGELLEVVIAEIKGTAARAVTS
jgi:hypothetical protein